MPRLPQEQFLLDYIEAAKITEGPLFRTAFRRTKQLTTKAMSGIDICRMMKPAAQGGGAAKDFSPYSFRVMTVTDLLGRTYPWTMARYTASFDRFCPGFLPSVLPLSCRPVCHSSRNSIYVNRR